MQYHHFLLCVFVAFAALSQNDLLCDSLHVPLAPESEQIHHGADSQQNAMRPQTPRVELMTQPCMGWHFQAACVLYNTESARELILLTAASEVGGAALLAVAPEEGASQSLQLPGTEGAWAIAPMTHDRVAVGTYPDGAIHIFDLTRWRVAQVVDIPDETHVWALVEGADGRLYGGTSPGGKLIVLNQDTLEFEDLGRGASSNSSLRHLSLLPDGRLLCHMGPEEPETLIYDPSSQSFAASPAAFQGIAGGVVWDSYLVTGDQVYDSELHPVTPPFPVPDKARGTWSLMPDISGARALYFRQGNAVYRLDADDARLTRVYDMDLRGGRLICPTRNGGVFGLRGQQYFSINPGDALLTRRNFTVASPPRIPAFLRVNATGQVWGAPDTGQTLFFMDGDTGVFVSMGSVVPGPGAVDALDFQGSLVYGVSSPGGMIFTLDINAPWDEWNGKNPSRLYSLWDKGYSRGTGGIRVSSEGLLISGWSADAAANGGAIAVTDPKTGKTRLLENPFGRQGITGLELDSDFIYVGTGIGSGDKAPGQDDTAQFGVIEKSTLRPHSYHEFRHANIVDRLCLNVPMNRLVMAVNNILRVYNVADKGMERVFSVELPTVTSSAIVERNDPYVYYGHDSTLVRVHVESGAWDDMVDLPDTIQALSVAESGDIYAASGINVFKITLSDE